jgi:hypothetical protein
MSWGFFLDLNLSLPTVTWKRLAKTVLNELPIPVGWWGFEDKALEYAFSQPLHDDMCFEEIFAWYEHGKDCLREVKTDGDRTHIRFCTILDKSSLYLSKPFASLVDAARLESADGTISLVNDGTYAGESGVVVKFANGELERERIEDPWPFVERLGTDIYGDIFTEPARAASAAMKASAKKSAKKPAAKKPAAKKPAAKKPALKKPAKKPAAKKPAKKPAKKKPSKRR